MNELTGLGSLELSLPSPAYLLGAIIFGAVGYIAFRRGRRASEPALTWAGITLMVYPYAVPVTWMLWVIGALLCSWIYLKWN